MAEFKNQKEFFQKNFYPINFEEKDVLDWLRKTFIFDSIYILKSLHNLYDKYNGNIPNEIQEKKIFQNYLYQNFYLRYKEDFDKFGIPYKIPTIAYWDESGTVYFIPISEYEGDLNRKEKDIVSSPNKKVKGISSYYAHHSIGMPFELFCSKLNSDVEYLNNFIELLSNLTLSEFVSLKNYLVAKIEFEEYSRKNENAGFVKIIRHNS